ncbi:Ubiquitin-conjugating enzyme E2 S [Ceratobasidium theobromae]|uniref:Ubiquitin-conjugating enzyme E2 S n=1 Tax=Ceratobasidium theobromae TaxID=1582974 RepID=A0A5N5QGT6_9AGAM|nr:Ubiquitin-conjugating enzyme E2 S [Ceratobasidium theobromae]
MVSPAAFRKLVKEITQLRNEPPEGIRIVQVRITHLLQFSKVAQSGHGAEGTPYAGGYFYVRFNFTDEFPAAPPRAAMVTKIFHPNVSRQGEICVNTLKKDWKPTYGLGHILVTIKCLLIYPNPESALDEESGKLLLEDWDEFCGRARMWTSVHATPKVPPQEFNTPAAASASPKPVVPASNSSPSAPSLVPTPASPKSKLDSVAAPTTAATQSPLQPSAANNTVHHVATVPGKSASGTENGNGPDVVMKLSPPTTDASKKDIAAGVAKTKRAATGGVEKKKKALKRL